MTTAKYKSYTIEADQANHSPTHKSYYIYRPGIFERIPADRDPKSQHAIGSASTLQEAKSKVDADIAFRYEQGKFILRLFGLGPKLAGDKG